MKLRLYTNTKHRNELPDQEITYVLERVLSIVNEMKALQLEIAI